jgi:hypothetical protein
LQSRHPPEITLTTSDENQIVSVCKRAVQTQLFELFQSIQAVEKLLPLVLNYITTVNGLTTAIFNETQLTILKFESAIVQRLKSKLQLRNEFLEADWATDDEKFDNLLDSVCKKHSTPSSFLLLSYNTLNSEYLQKATDAQKEILQNVWMEGNDLRKKIKQYKLPLSMVDKLQAQGVSQLDDLTDDNVKALVQSDQAEMKKQMSDKTNSITKNNVISDEHNRLKANMAQLLKKEGRQGKQEVAQHEKELTERKKRTEDAIHHVQDIKDNLNKLTTNSRNQLETKLKDIASKLNVNWRFTQDELNQPDTLLNSILSDLNNAKQQFIDSSCAAHKSDEEIIQLISSGIVLYGIQLTDPKRLGEKAQRPLLSRPTYCPLCSPSLPFQSTQHRFTSLNASNQFTQTIKTSGLTVATYLEASGWGFHANSSYSQSSQNNSTSVHQKKTQSTIAIQTDYMVVPIKCFRIPREEMKLSMEAENALAGINNSFKAKEFLRQFHSHVSDGVQHIGGIFMRIVTVETTEETDVQSLEALAAKTMSVSASVGGSYMGFSGGAGVSLESLETNANQQGTEKITRTATVKRQIQCIGPPCYNPDLFVQALQSNNSSWYIIDRDALSSFIPVWEIIQTQYKSQPHMIDAANLLKRAWLLDARDYGDNVSIQSEIQRIQCGDYTSSGIAKFNLIQSSANANGKSNLDTVEAEIKQCLDDFNICDLSPSMLLNKVSHLIQ